MKPIQHVNCTVCDATFPMMNNEPEGICPECDSNVQNPNYEFGDREMDLYDGLYCDTEAIRCGCEDYPCCGH